MGENSRLGPSDEYDTLRNELHESKKYVFERPLAITALAAVGLQVLDKPQHIALPIAVSLLTLFNLWFTVSRVRSASRIAAYIQLVLEPSGGYPWVGWETSLRHYRRWLRSKGKKATGYIDEKIDLEAAPDSLMFYTVVYYFHVALMTFAVLAGLVQLGQEKALPEGVLSFAPVGVGIWSLFYFWCYRPSKLCLSVERMRVIWQEALNKTASDKKKEMLAG